jgi:hypothetical protein
MATPFSRSVERPAKDEWGVYDPQQAGLAALYARLDTKETAPAPAIPAAVPERNTEVAPARPTLRDAK